KKRGDVTASGVLRSDLIALINANFSFGEAVHLLRSRAAETVSRKRRSIDPIEFLHREWNSALRWVRTHPPAADRITIQAEIAELNERVLSQSWPGLEGGSELKVLQ